MASELITLFAQKLAMKDEMMIDSLPNEMLLAVLSKLDAFKLIGCRRVNRHWKAVAEDICRDTRTVVIKEKDEKQDFFCVCQSFNGLVHFNKNCAFFIFEAKDKVFQTLSCISLSTGFCALLMKLYPQVENLIIYSALDRNCIGTTQNVLSLLNHRWSSSIVNLFFHYNVVHKLAELSDHMDNLTSLKRLHDASGNSFGASTLARLEHCAVDHQHLDKVIPQLGSACTSLNLCTYLSHYNLAHLYQLNPRLFKGLTHFSMRTSDPEALPYICANFTSLKMLHIALYYYQIFDADLVAQFARLPNLTQLSIVWFNVDLTALASCKPLKSVQILSLSRVIYNDEANPFNGDQFCRALSAIFPNVHQLTVHNRDQLVLDEISKHLNHFVHLQKHRIVISKY